MCSLQVQAYETIYPEMHPLLGLQLYTLGNLQIEAGGGAKNEGLVNLKRALAILKVSHGSDKSPMVEGLVSLIKHYTKDSCLVNHK
jgi:SET and MYND domain-containing protein